MVPELAQSIRSLKEAREHKNIAIKEFKNRLYAEFDTDRTVWLRAIRVLSELDCLFSLAKASNALGEPACRPEFVEGDSAWIEFQELRHPALSVSAGFRGDFIPNDVKLGKDVGRIALLTGMLVLSFNCVSPMLTFSQGQIWGKMSDIMPCTRTDILLSASRGKSTVCDVSSFY